MGELSLLQLVMLIASTTGGATWVVMRAHIFYINRNHERHEARLDNHSSRIKRLESGQ